jgi:hypothetical protein
MYKYNLDERDPFMQLIFRSVAASVGLFFVVACVLDSLVPELVRPLIVPFAVASFCGTLAFQVELKQKRYAFALLGVLSAVAMFPGMAWLLVRLLKVPFESGAAVFIALMPQAILAPDFFLFVRKRFKAGKG